MAAMDTLSKRPSRSSSVWAVLTSQAAMLAKPSESTSPNETMPVSSNERVLPPGATFTASPTSKCSLAAVPASMTTCSSPWGHSPVLSLSGVKRELAAS